MYESEQPEVDLEDQFILRLPLPEAEKIRQIMQTKPEKLKKTLKIDLDLGLGIGTVIIGKKKLHAYLRNFPTIIESYKTNIVNDKSNLYKTANVFHMVECFENLIESPKKEYPHGYTPPLKNVKKKRFRKTLVNPEVAEETDLITKELYYLLSTDLDAVSTRFEIFYEDTENEKGSTAKNSKIENMLFGYVSSSDSESDVDIIG